MSTLKLMVNWFKYQPRDPKRWRSATRHDIATYNFFNNLICWANVSTIFSNPRSLWRSPTAPSKTNRDHSAVIVVRIRVSEEWQFRPIVELHPADVARPNPLKFGYLSPHIGIVSYRTQSVNALNAAFYCPLTDLEFTLQDLGQRPF